MLVSEYFSFQPQTEAHEGGYVIQHDQDDLDVPFNL